jgi:Mg-chelatase subunit ChlD
MSRRSDRLIFQSLFFLWFLLFQIQAQNNSTPTAICQAPLDVVFLVDATDSMASTLSASASIFKDLLRSYYNDRDVQIGVAAFGGPPTLILPLIPKKKVI